jgi:excisionase family DNA binding protein
MGLDILESIDYNPVAVKSYTTKEAAEKLGVHRVTLQNWITGGNVPGPKIQNIGGAIFRLWSHADIERAREAIAKKGK